MATTSKRVPVILGPGQGRIYDCGTMRATFKADGDETASAYSVSEWRLEPRSAGPGPHLHEANDEIFLVTLGRPSLLVGDQWRDLDAGGVVVVPAGVTHDFENRSDAPAALFNVFIPGGFEASMPSIVEWFRGRG